MEKSDKNQQKIEKLSPGKYLEITQVRSVIGHPQKHRRIIKALGLKRIRHTVIHRDTPVIRGMLKKVPHLVSFVEKEIQ